MLLPSSFMLRELKNSRNTKKSSVCGRRRPRLHKTEYVGYCSSYLISVYNYVLSHASSYEKEKKIGE